MRRRIVDTTETAASLTLAMSKAEADKTRAIADDQAWQTQLDAFSQADEKYFSTTACDQWQWANKLAVLMQQTTDRSVKIQAAKLVAGAPYGPTAVDLSTYDQQLAALQKSTLDQTYQFYHDLGDAVIDDKKQRAKDKAQAADEYQHTYHLDEKNWAETLDAAERDNEIAVGNSLAQLDIDDTTARMTADEGIVEQAAQESLDEAGLEATDSNEVAADQQTQDAADEQASATFEETESDDYVQQLTTWATSLVGAGSPDPAALYATEQVAFAAADDAWLHSVITAQETQLAADDAEMVSYTDSADNESAQQTADDAQAVAAAVAASDDAAVERVTATDDAWKEEISQVAGDTYAYDKQAIEAAQGDADSVSDATRDFIDTFDGAEWTFEKALADIDLGDEINGPSSGDAAARAAAWHAEHETQLQARVDWVTAASGDYQTEITTVADDKVQWVTNVTDHEAEYLATAADAQATETTTDAETAAAMDGTFADDESAFETALSSDGDAQTNADESDQQTLVHDEAAADAADQVAYAQAGADYEDALWSSYATSVGNALSGVPSGSPEAALLNYYATVAGIQAAEVATDEAAVVADTQQLTAADVVESDQSEADAVLAADEAADAVGQAFQPDMADAQAQAVIQTADDEATSASADADAQAAYVAETSDAAAEYYQAKAADSRDYDVSVGAAGVTLAETEAADYQAYEEWGQQDPPDIDSEITAANAAYAAAKQTANLTLVEKQGDAEIAEATADGQDEETLAAALGGDEVSLATDLADINDTLSGESAVADEALVSTEDGDGSAQTIDDAQAGDHWTIANGTAAEAMQTALGSAEVTAAAAIAGAEATYAVAVAQSNASAAAVGQAFQPDNSAAAFQAAFADEYVNWLEALTPAFIANATAVATDDAANQDAAATADVNLQDQIAADDLQLTTTEAPEQAQQDEAL
ncbi:MAG TPA: hypothetical protein VFI31_08905, partial [Pirellulales bacterium]|nr:hypothetical protein [Pirellulales bacterium]